MKHFFEPDMEIVIFSVEDVIAASTTTELEIPDVAEGIGWN